MARLAATEKALYYPTPATVVGSISTHFQFQKPYNYGSAYREAPRYKSVIFDPCAGEGSALKLLCEQWGRGVAIPMGIELDTGRHAKASAAFEDLGGQCFQGSCFDYKVPKGSVQVLFLNPPYDVGARSSRQEVEFLEWATPMLSSNGLMIYIPPRHILKRNDFKALLKRDFTGIKVFDFPKPEVEQFDQVVLFAHRKQSRYSYDTIPSFENLEPLEESRHPVTLYPSTVTLPDVVMVEDALNPYTWAPCLDEDNLTGAYATTQHEMLFGVKPRYEDNPLTKPRPGHQALLLAAGSLNGTEFKDGKLLKGGSEKIEYVVGGDAPSTQEGSEPEEYVDGDSDSRTVTTRERIISRLATLDTVTGEIDLWRVNEEMEKTRLWFDQYGAEIAEAVERMHSPKFDGDLRPWESTFNRLTAPGMLPGHTTPEILPLQKETAAAINVGWRTYKAILLSGEQGLGKTTIATTAAECYRDTHKLGKAQKTRVVVVCPSHLVRKWIREVETITGVKGIAVTAKTITDVDNFFNPPPLVVDDTISFAKRKKAPKVNPEYLILSKETAKLGAPWKAVWGKRNSIEKEVTPERREYEKEEYDWYTRTNVMRRHWEWYDVTKNVVVSKYVCRSCFGALPMEPNVKLQEKCPHCKEPMYSYTALSAKGTKRWPLARYIAQRYARQYIVIADESHQYQNASAQGHAMLHLTSASKKVLAMTGTIYGGRASSIFFMLYMLNYNFRKMYKFTETDRFVAHHGLFETKKEEKDEYSKYGYRKGNTGGKVKEIPGMSPAMIPLILPTTIFVKLRDLRMELPPYQEFVETVEHEPEILASVNELEDNVKSVLREHPRVLGQYLQACLGYPDCSEQEEEIIDRGDPQDEFAIPETLATAPAFPMHPLPKDLRVLEIVKAELAEGRQCLIYMSQVHRRDARQRVKALLEDNGVRVSILDSSVPADKRETWLRDNTNFDVLITNGKLVETGLDLMFAKTIIQYGTEYSINTLRQSIRRSWRLGQCHPIKVIFLAYKGTMQEIALDLIARKMHAAELIDGDESGGLSSLDVGNTDIFIELAHEVIKKRGL